MFPLDGPQQQPDFQALDLQPGHHQHNKDCECRGSCGAVLHATVVCAAEAAAAAMRGQQQLQHVQQQQQHLQHPQPCNPKSDLLSGATSLGLGFSGRLRGQAGASAVLCTAALLAQGLPLGMSLARAVASHPDGSSAHVLLPAALACVPVGLACVGLGKAVLGVGRLAAAALALVFASVATLTAACCLATVPLGMVIVHGLNYALLPLCLHFAKFCKVYYKGT